MRCEIQLSENRMQNSWFISSSSKSTIFCDNNLNNNYFGSVFVEDYSCILFIINFTVIFILTATLLRLKVHMEAMRYLLYKKERYRYNNKSAILFMNLLFTSTQEAVLYSLSAGRRAYAWST